MAIVLGKDYWSPMTVETLQQPLPIVSTYLTDTFFGKTIPHAEKRVRFEYMDMVVSPANYTLDEAPAELTKMFTRGVSEIEIPRLTKAFPLDKSVLTERLVGETPWNSNLTINDRLDFYKRKISTGLMTDMKLAVELQCAELLQNGEINIEEYANGNLAKKSKATFSKDIKVSLQTKWDAPGVDVFADIEKYALQIEMSKAGQLKPNTVILGTDAYQAFMSNPKVIERLKVEKLNYGEIDFTKQNENEVVRPIGQLAFGVAGVLNVLAYMGKYTSKYDEKGDPMETKTFIDPKKVIICRTDIGARHYRPTVTMNESGRFEFTDRLTYFRSYADVKNQSLRFDIEGNILAAPSNQTWRCLEVLA